jgi:hypothetical protein
VVKSTTTRHQFTRTCAHSAQRNADIAQWAGETPETEHQDGRAHNGQCEQPRLAEWLDQDVDWDAEFEAELADLGRLIRSVAIQP